MLCNWVLRNSVHTAFSLPSLRLGGEAGSEEEEEEEERMKGPVLMRAM